MNAALAAVAAAVLTGSIGLAAAILGASNEHRKWLRDERLKAYLHLLVEASDATGGKVLASLQEEPEPGELLHQARTVPDALYQAALAVKLLGPSNMVGLAEEYRSATFALWMKPDDGDLRDKQNRTEDAFITAAHRGLKSHR